MAASPNPPGMSNPPTPPQRSDSASFSARADAFMSWLGNTLVTELTAALGWVRDALTDTKAARDAAATSASTASTKADAASTSATNAATSANTAATKADAASASATSAATSANTATTKADAASTSATSAATSANTATAKATEASTSATNAAASAANAGYANVTSTSSITMGAGSRSFVVNATRAYAPSLPVRVIYDASTYMEGTISAISGNTITVNVTSIVGSGTWSSWMFALIQSADTPTKSGAGATGTWPIGISGNAATASGAQAGSTLATTLAGKAPLDSPSFTGAPTVPTAAAGTNTTQAASTAFVRQEVANVVGSSPAALDTLNELAAALGNDANFAGTVNTALGNRVTKTSANRPGVTRLYRNDSDSDYNAQITWQADKTGYWSIRGYNADAYHAPVYVGYAGYADSAGTSNAISTSGALTAIAGAYSGGVGTYVLAVKGYVESGVLVAESTSFGETVAASHLVLMAPIVRSSSAADGGWWGMGANSTLAGTWRAMSYAEAPAAGNGYSLKASLWLRIA